MFVRQCLTEGGQRSGRGIGGQRFDRGETRGARRIRKAKACQGSAQHQAQLIVDQNFLEIVLGFAAERGTAQGIDNRDGLARAVGDDHGLIGFACQQTPIEERIEDKRGARRAAVSDGRDSGGLGLEIEALQRSEGQRRCVVGQRRTEQPQQPDQAHDEQHTARQSDTANEWHRVLAARGNGLEVRAQNGHARPCAGRENTGWSTRYL